MKLQHGLPTISAFVHSMFVREHHFYFLYHHLDLFVPFEVILLNRFECFINPYHGKFHAAVVLCSSRYIFIQNVLKMRK
jgi:hypothetical protein